MERSASVGLSANSPRGDFGAVAMRCGSVVFVVMAAGASVVTRQGTRAWLSPLLLYWWRRRLREEGPIEPPRALSRRRAVPPHPSHDPRRPHERVAAATRAPDSNGREARGTSLQIKRLLLSLAKCAAEAGVRGSKPLGATRAALTVPRAAPVARERAGARREHSPRPLKARRRCTPRVS